MKQTLLVLALAVNARGAFAQSPHITGAQFEVVAIKVNKTGEGGGMRSLPGGSYQATNIRFRQVILAGSPEPATEVEGLPDWANTEHYDINASAPEGSTRAQQGEMMRNMLIERLKLAGHVEERERDGFALVVARSDGKLGPQLKKSALDCRGADGPRCGSRMSPGAIESTGAMIDGFARSISGIAGGPVTNRTGLEGNYDLTLHYSRPGLTAAPDAAPDDAPSIFTAVQEQLGLKLVPEKTKAKVFVIDHIERPIPD
jgi:uncharacterized protein (TIGR03435 family)